MAFALCGCECRFRLPALPVPELTAGALEMDGVEAYGGAVNHLAQFQGRAKEVAFI